MLLYSLVTATIFFRGGFLLATIFVSFLSFRFKINNHMPYKVIDIEGIGPNYAAKLEQQGIATTSDLLEKGGTKKGRASLAEATGLPESLILTWVNHSDLHRIKGVAGQFSELLEAAGVDTVKEFATRNAENLHTKLVETNNQFGLSGKVPSAEALQAMIEQAKTLEQKVFH
jgi:predicted flap endonuclease-1-like 5' DNA nuclease